MQTKRGEIRDAIYKFAKTSHGET